jgi:cyclic pyranopterin phosphate synthase
MPSEGIHLIPHEDILRFEEIEDVVKVAVEMGITKVRITGGEPLVRKGIILLVRMIAGIEGIQDLGMTTNGILLEFYAESLVKAGLHRINISLDTMDPERYRQITRGGDLKMVLQGAMAAKKAGLSPVKINCVVNRSSDEPDARAVFRFCRDHGFEARFIHEMNLENGTFTIVENGHGGDCGTCNRLRLTANGNVKPCLFSNQGYNIRKLGIRTALQMALGEKPEKGSMNTKERFRSIGG